MRKPFVPYVENTALAAAPETRHKAPARNTYDQPVNLADVIDAAKEEAPATDADWS